MLERAIADVPGCEICRIELERGGASYFVETLESLRRDLGAGTPLRFLIGVDQALHFHRWKDWQRILEIATPAVMLRPPWDAESYRKALGERYEAQEAAEWASWTLEVPLMDVSATAIRKRLAAGESLEGLLAPTVEAYVRERGLYGAG
jgi:nicotinate-nucleotide adenylyltransferase